MFINTWLILALVAQPPAQSGGMDAAQFIRLIRGLQSKYRDQTFIYEGERRSSLPDLKRGGPNLQESEGFQGFYAQRSDSAAILDLFIRPGDPGRTSERSITSLLAGKVKRVSQSGDRKELSIREEDAAGRGTIPLEGMLSPQEFNFIGYYQFIDARYYETYNFRAVGEREVDGRPCLCVQYDLPTAVVDPTKAGLDYNLLYVDLERDGHPVRLERFLNGERVILADYRLAPVTFDDAQAGWFPVAATIEMFRYEDKTYSKPISTRTFQVVPSSIRINSGLADDVFSIEGNRQARFSDELKETLRRFEQSQAKGRTIPPSDYTSVQAELDRKLAEADAQSRRIDASAAAQPAGLSMHRLQIAAVIAGVALIGGAIFRHRRQ